MFKKRKNTSEEGQERPNLFVALQIDDPEIVGKIKRVQNTVIKQNGNLKEISVHAQKSHITTHVFNADESKLNEVKKAIEDAVQSHPSPLELILKNVRDFSKKVIHVQVDTDDNFTPLNERIFSNLNRIEHVKNLQDSYKSPHVTLFKSSRAKKFKLKRAKIDLSPFEEFKDEDFGVQKCKGVQLLSMIKPPFNDYYYKYFEVPFGEP